MGKRKNIGTSDNTNALSEYVYFDFCPTCDITTIRNIPKFKNKIYTIIIKTDISTRHDITEI